MTETKHPRKIIGMNRNSTMNTSYSPEALDEFLHGYKGAWADEARKDQLKWPTTPVQDKNLIWPSQVTLYPSLAVVEDVYLNVYSKQKPLKDSNFKELNQNPVGESYNQIYDTNVDSINYKKPSAFKSFNLKVDTEEVTSKSINSNANKNVRSKIEYSDNQEIFNTTTVHDDLKAISLSCAEDGERIARIHCNRPFFKKIDGLCDRIKQDLIYHDSVIPQVNAHGIVWAIKDLIFVCTRIINAWNIAKGYVYDSSDGLNKVRSTLTFEFVPSFIAWQKTAIVFMESLLMSFLSLDIFVRTENNSLKRFEFLQKLDAFMLNLRSEMKTCSSNSKCNNTTWEQCGCDTCKNIISSKGTHDAFIEFSVICTEYGEKVAQNYLKRPFFKKVDSLCNRTKFELITGDGALPNLNSQGTVWAIKELIFASTRIINAWNITKGYVYASSEGLDKVRVGLSSDFVPSFIAWQEATKKFVENLRMSFQKLDNLAHTEINSFKKDGISKPIIVFKEYLQHLKSAEVFFKTLFCRNYFPDFIAKTPDFMDVRSIIKKCQSGGYRHINEVVHDVRFIIYQVKKYLMINFDPNLDGAVNKFQTDVDNGLAHKSLKDYHFDHIEGRPNETLFV